MARELTDRIDAPSPAVVPRGPWWAWLPALVSVLAVVSTVAAGDGGGDGAENAGGSPPRSSFHTVVLGAGSGAVVSKMRPQFQGSPDDAHFALWCGSARGVPELQVAENFVIQWGDPVSAEKLPAVAFAKEVAPEVVAYNEYGAYRIPGATGQEAWIEATIYCIDGFGAPISVIPAVLDRQQYADS